MTNQNDSVYSHDRVFRASMSDLRVAKDFMQHYLPDKIKQAVNLDTLALRKESYVDTELQSSIADVVYSVDFIKPKQVSGFIYVLAEHQSNAHRLMPFRIIKYTCRIIEQHLKQAKNAELPIVVPLVFYNGQNYYPYSTDVFDLFGENQSLAREYMFKSFQLIDISQIPDEEIRKHEWSGLMEFIMKHIYVRDMLLYLRQAIDDMQRLAREDGEDYLLAVLKYILNRSEMQNKAEFFTIVEQSLPKTIKGDFMTIADMLRAEGFEEGMKNKLEEIKEVRLQMAKKLLEFTNDMKLISQTTGLSLTEIESFQETA